MNVLTYSNKTTIPGQGGYKLLHDSDRKFKKETLDRQIMEKNQISNYKGDILTNRKNELGGSILEREQFKYRRWGAGGITGGQRAAGTI